MSLECCDGKVESMILLIFLIACTLFLFFWGCAGQMRFHVNRASLQPVRRINASLWMDLFSSLFVLFSLWTFWLVRLAFPNQTRRYYLREQFFQISLLCMCILVLRTGMCMHNLWKNISGIFLGFSTWILDVPYCVLVVRGKALWELKLFPDPQGRVNNSFAYICLQFPQSLDSNAFALGASLKMKPLLTFSSLYLTFHHPLQLYQQ